MENVKKYLLLAVTMLILSIVGILVTALGGFVLHDYWNWFIYGVLSDRSLTTAQGVGLFFCAYIPITMLLTAFGLAYDISPRRGSNSFVSGMMVNINYAILFAGLWAGGWVAQHFI